MTQRQRTQRLAAAFKRLDRAKAECEAAQRELDETFFPWAAGRSIDRGKAREQLVSLGYLEYNEV